MLILHLRLLTNAGVFWSVWLGGSETWWAKSRNHKNYVVLPTRFANSQPNFWKCSYVS